MIARQVIVVEDSDFEYRIIGAQAEVTYGSEAHQLHGTVAVAMPREADETREERQWWIGDKESDLRSQRLGGDL